jgi:ribonuclease PH
MIRVDGRNPDELRKIKITMSYLRNAEGSALIEFGGTEVICSATIENKIPPHLKETGGGWITAEYSMLPRSSAQRIARETPARLNNRAREIQRLIGRSLRAAVDLQRLGERTITIDCDVIQADGGTRTASITGGFIALYQALQKLQCEGQLKEIPIHDFAAAVSVGIVEDTPVLDLCYIEDAQAEVDMNVVMNEKGKFIEVQGTAESAPFSKSQMDEMLKLAKKGIFELIEMQKKALKIDALEK